MTKSKTKIDPNLIDLLSVRVIKGSIETNPDIDNSQLFSFNTSFEVLHGIDESNQFMRFVFGVKFQAISKENINIDITAEYTTEFIFKVENLLEFVVEKNTDNIAVDPLLAGTLMGIVYSTTRGIILTRTQGTICDGVILPVIDPHTLLIGDKK